MRTVYFEIYGKKMKVNIDVDSSEEAKQKVRDSIKFHKVTGDCKAMPGILDKDLKKIFDLFEGM